MASSSYSIQENGTQIGVNSNHTTADNLSQFSVSFWTKFNTDPTSNDVIIAKRADNVNSLGWNFQKNNGLISGIAIVFELVFTGAAFSESYTSVDCGDNNWHSIVGTWNNGTPHIYVDGTDVTVTPHNDPPASFSNTIPISFSDTANSFNYTGDLDDVRIWNRVLSSSEASVIAAGGDPSSTGLLTYWRIEEGSGSTLNDSSGNGNTITFGTAPTWITDVPPPLRVPLTWNLSETITDTDSLTNKPEIPLMDSLPTPADSIAMIPNALLSDTASSTDALLLKPNIPLVDVIATTDSFGQIVYPGFSDTLRLNEWIQYDLEPANPWTDNG